MEGLIDIRTAANDHYSDFLQGISSHLGIYKTSANPISSDEE